MQRILWKDSFECSSQVAKYFPFLPVYCTKPFTWLLSPFPTHFPIGNFAFVAFVPLHRKMNETKTHSAFSICNIVFNDFSFEQISCYLTTPGLSFSRFLPAFNFLCNSLWAETMRRWLPLPISLALSSYPKKKNFPKKQKNKVSHRYNDEASAHVCNCGCCCHFPKGICKVMARAFPTLNWMCAGFSQNGTHNGQICLGFGNLNGLLNLST